MYERTAFFLLTITDPEVLNKLTDEQRARKETENLRIKILVKVRPPTDLQVSVLGRR